MSGAVSYILPLTGQPWPHRGAVKMEVPVWTAPPGEATTLRAMATLSPARFSTPGKMWVPIAGPYRIKSGSYEEPDAKITQRMADLEREQLIRAIWDMDGRPPGPGMARRRRASWVLVEEPGGLTIYRDASEVLSSMAAGLYQEAGAERLGKQKEVAA